MDVKRTVLQISNILKVVVYTSANTAAYRYFVKKTKEWRQWLAFKTLVWIFPQIYDNLYSVYYKIILSGSNLQYYIENTQDHVTSVPFSHLHFLIKKTIPLASLLEKLSSTETTASIENVSLNEVQCTSSMIMIKCYLI